VPPTVAPTSAPINGVNLLQNADFENGSTPWQFLASGRTATAATIVSSGAQNGNNAVKIASDLYVRQGWITVTPGKTYELTGWYKWVQYSGSNWGYDRVRVDENTWAELASINVLHSKFPQNTWSQFKLTFTPKTKAVNISIGQFGPQDRVEFYFDNLVLVEQGAAVPTTVPTTAPTVTKTVVAPTNTVVAPTAVQPTVTKTAVQPTAVAPTATPINPVGGNMVQNGSFESGAVAPWSDITNTNLVSNVAHTGTRSVRINSNLEAKQGWIPVTPGKTYELTMWYRWDEFSGSNWGYDRVRVANYDWSEAAVKNQLHTLYPRNTWNLVSLTFTPPRILSTSALASLVRRTALTCTLTMSSWWRRAPAGSSPPPPSLPPRQPPFRPLPPRFPPHPRLWSLQRPLLLQRQSSPRRPRPRRPHPHRSPRG
jgi:hypothetical protein